jgi:hypothetical protein
MKTVKKLLNRTQKPQITGTPKTKDPNTPTPGLEQAKTVFKALANVGDGAINVPGLKAASQLVVQIIEVAQVRRGRDKASMDAHAMSMMNMYFRKSKVIRLIAPLSPNGHASLYKLQLMQSQESPNMESTIA